MRAPQLFNQRPELSWHTAIFLNKAPGGTGPLAWWYGHTAPIELPADTDLRRQEKIRRGRLISLIVLFTITCTVIGTAIALFTQNLLLVGSLIPEIGTNLLALRLNRRGNVSLAGWFIVLAALGSFIAMRVFSSAQVSVGDLPDYDLIIVVELLAIMLLAARSVFVVCGLNSLYIITDILLRPHTPPLIQFVSSTGYAIILGRPIALEVVVAAVGYLWARSTSLALARADRAQVVAALEHAIAVQKRQAQSQQFALQQSIEVLVQTHRKVASGDFHARVHLPDNDPLIPVGESLNALLMRWQRLLAEAEELERTKIQGASLVSALHQATETGSLKLPEKGAGTIVDLIILELMRYTRRSSSSQ